MHSSDLKLDFWELKKTCLFQQITLFLINAMNFCAAGLVSTVQHTHTHTVCPIPYLDHIFYQTYAALAFAWAV